MIRKVQFFLCLAVFAAFAPVPARAGEEEQLSLPRFASLKEDKVFVRTGPDQQYPIRWVYQRTGLPVEITQEYDAWRKIRDFDGATGWVHKAMLSGKRMGLITAKEPITALDEPESGSRAVVAFEPGVVVFLQECTPDWCEVRAAGFRAWLPKENLWGVYDADVFEE